MQRILYTESKSYYTAILLFLRNLLTLKSDLKMILRFYETFQTHFFRKGSAFLGYTVVATKERLAAL